MKVLEIRVPCTLRKYNGTGTAVAENGVARTVVFKLIVMPQRAVETSQAHRGARGDKGRALVRVRVWWWCVRVCVCACVWWSMTTNLARLDHASRQVHHSLELYRIGGEEPILVLMVSVLCF